MTLAFRHLALTEKSEMSDSFVVFFSSPYFQRYFGFFVLTYLIHVLIFGFDTAGFILILVLN